MWLGESKSAYYNLHGVMQHNLYHVGDHLTEKLVA